MRDRTSIRVRLLAVVLACVTAGPCQAASGEFVDKAATFLAVFIITALPIGGIVLFWLVGIVVGTVVFFVRIAVLVALVAGGFSVGYGLNQSGAP